jgi:hypothetical protein
LFENASERHSSSSKPASPPIASRGMLGLPLARYAFVVDGVLAEGRELGESRTDGASIHHPAVIRSGPSRFADLFASDLPNILAVIVRFTEAATNAFMIRFSRPGMILERFTKLAQGRWLLSVAGRLAKICSRRLFQPLSKRLGPRRDHAKLLLSVMGPITPLKMRVRTAIKVRAHALAGQSAEVGYPQCR